MENTNLPQPGTLRVMHPSFRQCLDLFVVPLVLFLFAFLGVNIFYVWMAVWILEMILLLVVWIFLASTIYVIKSDRIEIHTGILAKYSTAIPFDKIIDITCKQNIFQKLLDIGNIFIEILGVEPSEIALIGVERHEQVAELLFALKKRGAA
jgi:uncharacterized membrane protein YdbT with pleckstrin-like domain